MSDPAINHTEAAARAVLAVHGPAVASGATTENVVIGALYAAYLMTRGRPELAMPAIATLRTCLDALAEQEGVKATGWREAAQAQAEAEGAGVDRVDELVEHWLHARDSHAPGALLDAARASLKGRRGAADGTTPRPDPAP